MRKAKPKTIGGTILAIIAALVVAWQQYQAQSKPGSGGSSSSGSTAQASPPRAPSSSPRAESTPTSTPVTRPAGKAGTGVEQSVAEGERAVLAGFKAGRSDFWATVEGEVVKVLPDDDDGDRHQKFLVELSGGHTLLIAHNLDIAPRVPVEEGDRVKLRGEYEYKDKGGVMHWTHHDPGGRKPGGWIELGGKRYE